MPSPRRRGHVPAAEYYRIQRAKKNRPADAIVVGETANGEQVFLTEPQRRTHVQTMGPTGGGKTKLLEIVARTLIQQNGEGVLVLDPNGDFAEDLKVFCYANGFEDRVIALDFSTPGPILGFNPMKAGASTNLAVEAARDVQVLMRAWGQTEFIATPRMARWLFNTFYAVRHARGSYLEAQAVLNPLPTTLGRAIALAVQEPMVRDELVWLTEVAADRVREERIESSYARLKNFLLNPYVKLMVGQTERVFDPASVIDEKKIVLVNLQESEFLTDEDSRLLGTLLFSAFCREAISRSPKRRRPFTIIADEFYRFVSNEAALLLNTGRKFMMSLILAHQYPDQLVQTAGGVLDRGVLEAVRACARTKILFGDLEPEQYKGFAEKIAVRTFDPYQVKQERYVMRQLIDGFETVTLHGSSHATGRGRGAGSTVPFAPDVLGGQDLSDFGFVSDSEQANESDAASEHESLMPIYNTFRELGSREFIRYEEHLLGVMKALINQPDQHGCFIPRGGGTAFFRVTTVKPVTLPTERIEELDRVIRSDPRNPYSPVEMIEAEIETRERRLSGADARALKPPPSPAGTPLTLEQAKLLGDKAAGTNGPKPKPAQRSARASAKK